MSIMSVRILPQTYSGQNVAIGESLQSQTKRKEYSYTMCWSLVCATSLNLQSMASMLIGCSVTLFPCPSWACALSRRHTVASEVITEQGLEPANRGHQYISVDSLTVAPASNLQKFLWRWAACRHCAACRSVPPLFDYGH